MEEHEAHEDLGIAPLEVFAAMVMEGELDTVKRPHNGMGFVFVSGLGFGDIHATAAHDFQDGDLDETCAAVEKDDGRDHEEQEGVAADKDGDTDQKPERA